MLFAGEGYKVGDVHEDWGTRCQGPRGHLRR